MGYDFLRCANNYLDSISFRKRHTPGIFADKSNTEGYLK